MIKSNSLLSRSLFADNFSRSILLHIPHSQTVIPDEYLSNYCSNQLLHEEIHKLTDHATDLIFDTPDVEKLVFEYSRVFCDVERLDDENEVMFRFGRGFYYTKTDDGRDLRLLNEETKNKI